MLDQQYHEELRALRDLERALRAHGLHAIAASSDGQPNAISIALNAVTDARKRSIRKSKFTPAK